VAFALLFLASIVLSVVKPPALSRRQRNLRIVVGALTLACLLVARLAKH